MIKRLVNKKVYQLSCIIPVYNVEQYVEKCIDSLLKIKSIDVEIILVNDGSTDSSPIILNRYAESYSSIKVIHQLNQGLSAARNLGLKEANGEYIAFIDSDDWIISEQLVNLYEQAKQADVDLLLGNILFVPIKGKVYSPFSPLPEFVTKNILLGSDCFVYLNKTGMFVPMATSYLYRSKWLKDMDLYFEPILHEDELWTTKALCLANKVICTNCTFYYYRQRLDSIMNTLETGKRINSLVYIANRILAFTNFFDRKGQLSLWSMLYLKAAQLYKIAFELLDKVNDNDFLLRSHSLYQFFHQKKSLSPEVQCVFAEYYRIARYQLKSFILEKYRKIQ